MAPHRSAIGDVLVPGDVIIAELLQPSATHPVGLEPMDYYCEVKLPDSFTPGGFCEAAVWGYTAYGLDIFSTGVCIFILNWRVSPWGCTSLADYWVRYARTHGIRALVDEFGLPRLEDDAMQLLEEMLSFVPSMRPSAEECLQRLGADPAAAPPLQARPPDADPEVEPDRERCARCGRVACGCPHQSITSSAVGQQQPASPANGGSATSSSASASASSSDASDDEAQSDASTSIVSALFACHLNVDEGDGVQDQAPPVET